MSTADVDGYIRVYFPDGAWSTVPVKSSMPAWMLCEIIARKRNLLTSRKTEDNATVIPAQSNATPTPPSLPRAVSMLHVPDGPSPGIEQYGLYMQDTSADRLTERRLGSDEKPLSLQETARKAGQLDKIKFFFKKNPGTSPTAAASMNNTQANAATASIPPQTPSTPTPNTAYAPVSGSSVPPVSTPLSPSSSGQFPSDQDSPWDRPNLTPAIDENAELNRKLQKIKKAFNAHHVGYLEKRGRSSTQWRERWFILQYEKLFYFKSHEETTAINFIPLGDATVRILPWQQAMQLNDPQVAASGGETGSPFAALASFPPPPPALINSLPAPPASVAPRSPYDRFVLEINTATRFFYLRARSYRDMQEWVRALRKQTKIDTANSALDEVQLAVDESAISRSILDERREFQLQSKNFPYFIHDFICLKNFLAYAQENHCEENLLFWMDAEEYRLSSSSRTPEQRTQRAKDIFQLYCAEGAQYELLVQANERMQLQKAVENDPDGMAFLSLQQSVYSYMESGMYVNFLRSKAFKRCLIGIEPRRGPSSASIPYLKFLLDRKAQFQRARDARMAAREENELQPGDRDEMSRMGDNGEFDTPTRARMENNPMSPNSAASANASSMGGLFSPAASIASVTSPMFSAAMAASASVNTLNSFLLSSTAAEMRAGEDRGHFGGGVSSIASSKLTASASPVSPTSGSSIAGIGAVSSASASAAAAGGGGGLISISSSSTLLAAAAVNASRKP